MTDSHKVSNSHVWKETPIFFHTCLYTPVSFVMFLVALTFPLVPSVDEIAVYNLWVQCLFQIIPLKFNLPNSFSIHPKLFTSRKQFIELALNLHLQILKENLQNTSVFTMFAALRANDCGGTSFESNSHLLPEQAPQQHVPPKAQGSTKKVEASCTRKNSTMSVVCAIAVARDHMPASFMMDSNVRPTDLPTDIDVVGDAFTNERAFCSCIFSAKWFVLHMLAFAFDPKQRDIHHIFLQLFGKVLACHACRHNFQENLKQVNFDASKDLRSRDSYRHFIYRLHANVNAMLGKDAQTPSFEEHVRTFDNFYKTTTPEHRCSIVITDAKHAKQRFYLVP